MNSNAVIVRAGKASQHSQWLAGETPNFDLIVVAYEDIPEALAARAALYVVLPGSKVAGWHEFFREHPDILNKYETIALIDDDIECDATKLNSCFEIGVRFGLKLWQPSLTPESFFSYAICVRNPAFLLRYVSFVEMMCPFFSTDFLRQVLPLFALGYETGVDRLWSVCCPTPQKSCAIVDQVSVRHGRRVGQDRAKQGFVGASATYDGVLEKMHNITGMRPRMPRTFSGITSRGRIIEVRLFTILLSLTPLLQLRRLNDPKPIKKFGILVKANLFHNIEPQQKVMDVIDRFRSSESRANQTAARGLHGQET